MNRYFFWMLMVLPWASLSFYISFGPKSESTSMLFLALFAYMMAIIEVRRRSIGLTLPSTLKALVPGIGYKEWQRLYFAKP